MLESSSLLNCTMNIYVADFVADIVTFHIFSDMRIADTHHDVLPTRRWRISVQIFWIESVQISLECIT